MAIIMAREGISIGCRKHGASQQQKEELFRIATLGEDVQRPSMKKV